MATTAREMALAQLEALLKVPGSLKVITNEHACKGGRVPTTPAERVRCDESVPDRKHPSHFVLHDVVKLEKHPSNGQVMAITAEGDATMGQPEHVLLRVTEWQREQRG